MPLLVVLSFLFGLTCKYADLLDEHGLQEPFPGTRMGAGIAWGCCAVGIMWTSPIAGIATLALILYWLTRNKLDYPNHALGGALALLVCVGWFGDYIAQHRLALTLVFGSYLLAGYIRSACRSRYPKSRLLWTLHLPIYLIPLGYSLYSHNPAPLIATVSGMIPTQFLKIAFDKSKLRSQ